MSLLAESATNISDLGIFGNFWGDGAASAQIVDTLAGRRVSSTPGKRLAEARRATHSASLGEVMTHPYSCHLFVLFCSMIRVLQDKWNLGFVVSPWCMKPQNKNQFALITSIAVLFSHTLIRVCMPPLSCKRCFMMVHMFLAQLQRPASTLPHRLTSPM